MVDSFNYNNKFIPSGNKILLFIGQDKDNIQAYINSVKVIPAGFMTYTSIQSMDGIYIPVDHGSGVMHFQFLINEYPNTVIQVGLWMVGALVDTIMGVYDNNLLKFANWAKGIYAPIYLRIGYEFDAPFNCYDPILYIKAYRYIVDKFREYGVDNISYVWHSYAGNNNIIIKNWYPGDNYVDWCGISYFNNISINCSMSSFAKNKNKPLMIAEATPQGMRVGEDLEIWNKWYRSFFDFIYDPNNNVRAVSYINENWDIKAMWVGQNWGDTRVQMDEVIKHKWVHEINKNIFLNSTVNLYEWLQVD